MTARTWLLQSSVLLCTSLLAQAGTLNLSPITGTIPGVSIDTSSLVPVSVTPFSLPNTLTSVDVSFTWNYSGNGTVLASGTINGCMPGPPPCMPMPLPGSGSYSISGSLASILPNSQSISSHGSTSGTITNLGLDPVAVPTSASFSVTTPATVSETLAFTAFTGANWTLSLQPQSFVFSNFSPVTVQSINYTVNVTYVYSDAPSVPEPSTLALLAPIAAWVIYRRKY